MTICSCCRGYSTSSSAPDNGRSPRGERGLKQRADVLWRGSPPVAPRVGSVDWNRTDTKPKQDSGGRSPRGERGLKLRVGFKSPGAPRVAPRVGSVD